MFLDDWEVGTYMGDPGKSTETGDLAVGLPTGTQMS